LQRKRGAAERLLLFALEEPRRTSRKRAAREHEKRADECAARASHHNLEVIGVFFFDPKRKIPTTESKLLKLQDSS
jgi:hypothetical protein